MIRQRFIVLVREDLNERAFGAYRSFRVASGDAKAWNGTVVPIENPADAPDPWDAGYHSPTRPTR